ncbi:MAG: SUMF1/EgtB/PvdO family nonheme iron enzyme, partial [Myxococcota bacterium]|nr:SUMF1/EgtB/PvdO family nonheme iron enzyme [Myxococcota bacterium]
WGGMACDVCPANYMGDSCDRCSNGWTGALCNICGSNYEGAACDSCSNGWTGTSCDECPANYTGADCNTCAGEWSGTMCDECPANYTGAACDMCSNGWTGTSCDVCPVNFTGAACDMCAGEWSGPLCDLCPANYTGESCDTCSNGWMGESCDECPANYTGTSCDTCSNGWTGVMCDVCPPNYTGAACDTCASNFAGPECGECSNGWVGIACDECPPNYTGAACDMCAGEWSGAACDECPPNYTGATCDTCSNGWTGATCDECPSNYIGAACDTCANGWAGDTCSIPADYTGFIGIASGSFTMGCTASQSLCDFDESPHEVTLTRAFWLSETEVTQSEYETLVGSNPSGFIGCGDCPVETVNWFETLAYANALSLSQGLAPCFDISGSTVTVLSTSGNPYDCEGYRLPTEAEWEYAARAGTNVLYAGSDDVELVGWYTANSDKQTHPVATKAPNAWGIYDMSGNISEWCWDWHLSDYYTDSPSADPVGPTDSPVRVARGGSWIYDASYLRVSNRSGVGPSLQVNQIGFRLARTAP